MGRKSKRQEGGDCCEAETQEEGTVVLLLVYGKQPSYLEGLTAIPVKSGIRQYIAMDPSLLDSLYHEFLIHIGEGCKTFSIIIFRNLASIIISI